MHERRYNTSLPEAPEEFTRAILESRALIRHHQRRMRMFRKCALVAAGALAAVVAVFVGMGAISHPEEDSIAVRQPVAPEATPAVENPAIQLPAAPAFEDAQEFAPHGEVFAHPEDAYYHLLSDCGQCREDAVPLPMDTALHFGKQPCPVCGVEMN